MTTATATATTAVQDFAKLQTEKQTAAAKRYREIVFGMASGNISALGIADELGDILRRLDLTQDNLSADVDAAVEHARLVEERVAFDRERPALMKKHEELSAAVKAAQVNARRAERLHREAIQHRRAFGAPQGNRLRWRDKRLAELEGNLRLFPAPASPAVESGS